MQDESIGVVGRHVNRHGVVRDEPQALQLGIDGLDGVTVHLDDFELLPGAALPSSAILTGCGEATVLKIERCPDLSDDPNVGIVTKRRPSEAARRWRRQPPADARGRSNPSCGARNFAGPPTMCVGGTSAVGLYDGMFPAG